MQPDPSHVLGFWFSDAARERWFSSTPEFDREVRERLGALHEAAATGALDAWGASAEGALALVVLLDQAPRNAFRGTARMYATDARALEAAKAAVAAGHDLAFPDDDRRMFLYLPYEHSEDLADQRECVRLVAERISDPEYLGYARRHLEVVERFGRFPHRNALLGRDSTAEELAFLREPGSSF
jgi:uncharacterized protein (DUF924 family)